MDWDTWQYIKKLKTKIINLENRITLLEKKVKNAKKESKKPAPKKMPKPEEKSEIWTTVGYEKFLTEAIEEYKKINGNPIRGGNVTLAFRKWYNKRDNKMIE